MCSPSHELKATLKMDKPSTRRSPQCVSQAMDDFHLTVKMYCSAHVPPSLPLWGWGGNGGAGPCVSCAVLSQDQLHARCWQRPTPAAIATERLHSQCWWLPLCQLSLCPGLQGSAVEVLIWDGHQQEMKGIPDGSELGRYLGSNSGQVLKRKALGMHNTAERGRSDCPVHTGLRWLAKEPFKKLHKSHGP